MPKPYTNPTLYNEALQLNIAKLKNWGYLKPDKIIDTTLQWNRQGVQIGDISILINTTGINFYVELDYKYKGEPRKYKIDIVSVPSNLGKGEVLYFLCPVTKKRCRILYSVGGYFLHRKAFKGCMYDCQTVSKKYRELNKLFIPEYKIDKLYSEKNKKHFKKTYAGRPTKRYLQLMKLIEKSERVTPEMYENYLKSK